MATTKRNDFLGGLVGPSKKKTKKKPRATPFVLAGQQPVAAASITDPLAPRAVPRGPLPSPGELREIQRQRGLLGIFGTPEAAASPAPQAPVNETTKAADSIIGRARANMMQYNPSLARTAYGQPSRSPQALGPGLPAYAQIFDTSSRENLSPVELQTRSAAPWQPNLAPAPTLSAEAAASRAQRQQVAADNTSYADALIGTPRNEGTFSGTFDEFVDATADFKRKTLAGDPSATRPARWQSSPGDGGVPFDPTNEKLQAAREKRKDERDIRQRMVAGKAQGRKLTAADAIMERSQEGIQRRIEAGEELTRDQRTPQQNAQFDAAEKARLEALTGIVAALRGPDGTGDVDEDLVESLMGRRGSAAGGGPQSPANAIMGGAGGAVSPVTLRAANKVATKIFDTTPDIEPADFESQLRRQSPGIDEDTIEEIGLARFGVKVWIARNDNILLRRNPLGPFAPASTPTFGELGRGAGIL